jgi:hypothetical protein
MTNTRCQSAVSEESERGCGHMELRGGRGEQAAGGVFVAVKISERPSQVHLQESPPDSLSTRMQQRREEV